ncbi:MAG: CAP domain-containing protein [Eubacterium sp.]|nr:CAP domain-containing protein [Eubacterium sp.]
MNTKYEIRLTRGGTTKVEGHFDDNLEKQMVDMLNDYRRKNGLPALKVKKALEKAADKRAEESSYLFSHIRPNGKNWSTVSAFTRGENLASGNNSIQSQLDLWKRSMSHRANLLKKDFKTVGVSCFWRRYRSKLGKTYYLRYTVIEFG